MSFGMRDMDSGTMKYAKRAALGVYVYEKKKK
jgi:hypothetical protein